jgi:chorismate-pyruvate lyase
MNISALPITFAESLPAANGAFDPFADLMLNQAARPRHWQPVDLRALTPFQRALLAIDGTVTKFIEAYTLEPVEITRLQQQEQPLSADHRWLAAPAGTPVIARQVLLCGKYSVTIYAYAVSLLIADRLPLEVLHGLDVEPAGLGRILLNSQLENRREVLWYGREQIADLPETIEIYTGNDFLSRTYRIIVGGQPLMLISEKFPFADPQTPQNGKPLLCQHQQSIR